MRATSPRATGEAGHLMRAEIAEIPAAIERLLSTGAKPVAAAADAIAAKRPRWASIVARGTSDHAATYGRYLFETQLGLPTSLAAASVLTIYGAHLDWSDGLLVAISQSGEGPDVVALVDEARTRGGLTVAITNERDAPLARAAEHVLACDVGRELAVPATKTYVAELAILAALIAALRPQSGTARSLSAVPDALAVALSEGAAWAAAAAAAFRDGDRALLVARGYNLATAMEIALKLKETSRLFADGYSAADLQHGPLALADRRVPVIAVRADGPSAASVDAATDAVAARGAPVWWIGGGDLPRIENACRLDLPLPEELTPLPYVLPGYLLAERIADARGIDPDAPAGLHKVTRTR